MRTYPDNQVAVVRDAQARRILTESGLPDDGVAPFDPAAALRPLADDPRYIMLGGWGDEGARIALDTVDGRVVTYVDWKPDKYRINTSLRRFVDSLNAISEAAPLTEGHYGSLDLAGDRVLAELARIEPDELSDRESFWRDIVYDIKNGDYAED
jgi:SUKH-4 immunity protein